MVPQRAQTQGVDDMVADIKKSARRGSAEKSMVEVASRKKMTSSLTRKKRFFRFTCRIRRTRQKKKPKLKACSNTLPDTWRVRQGSSPGVLFKCDS